MTGFMRHIVRLILRILYRVEVRGAEHYTQARDGVLIVSNHVSYLDGVLLYAFFPAKLSFAINTTIAQAGHVKFAGFFTTLVTIDPTNPLSIRDMIRRLAGGEKLVIFPEGRISVTGSLMKIYQGPGMAADKSGVPVLPVTIDGAQFTRFSRLEYGIKRRWFTKITITLFPMERIDIPGTLHGRSRREEAGRQLSRIMTHAIFKSKDADSSLFAHLLEARRIYGGDKVIAEDINRKPVSYDSLIVKAVILGRVFVRHVNRDEYAGMLLPNSIANVVAFFGLHIYGRVPVMLNYSMGWHAIQSSCRTARIRFILTSRKFLEAAGLQGIETQLPAGIKILYLEDVAASVSLWQKAAGYIAGHWPFFLSVFADGAVNAQKTAMVLFTSGSEGEPKGVVLSHANVLANIHQLRSRMDFLPNDIVLNVLPMFHAFGLTMGTLLPLFSGMRTFYYPNPLHYRIIPELAYDINATILFGTNTFLQGYARNAHPYDFYKVRYVFAGAEKLKDDVKALWGAKFGLRVLEGYGATEASPVVSANTLMEYRSGSVGKILPGIEYCLLPVEGIEQGGRLCIRGINIMRGYLMPANPGVIQFPVTELGNGWYDTGDIAFIDEDGYLHISGRSKRFAKVGGEMVSLAAVESLAGQIWPDSIHAAVTLPDERKGEQIILVTNFSGAERPLLMAQAKREGLSELCVPRRILFLKALPVLGSGKVDYVAVSRFVRENADKPD